MTYNQVKQLKPAEFKRLCGVQPETFKCMVEIVNQRHQQIKPGIGRPSKLTVEDQVLMTLEYLREYRTYFHIAQSWGVNESTAYRIIRKVEDYLIASRVFSLPGKKKLLEADQSAMVVVVDVTESQIERPQKNRNGFTVAKRKDTLSSLRCL
jgi:Helix-turn-helix of DDE superfamily endonuclease